MIRNKQKEIGNIIYFLEQEYYFVEYNDFYGHKQAKFYNKEEALQFAEAMYKKYNSSVRVLNSRGNVVYKFKKTYRVIVKDGVGTTEFSFEDKKEAIDFAEKQDADEVYIKENVETDDELLLVKMKFQYKIMISYVEGSPEQIKSLHATREEAIFEAQKLSEEGVYYSIRVVKL